MWTIPRSSSVLLAMLLCLFSFMSLQTWAAIAPAGAKIENQAKVIYFDIADGKIKEMYSNVAVIRVARLIDFQLEFDNQLYAVPGQSIYLPHRLINTGNTATDYQLAVQALGNDSGDLENTRVFIDADSNGSVTQGETELISETCRYPAANKTCYHINVLNPGAVLELIVSAQVKTTAKLGDSYALRASLIANVSDNATPLATATPKAVTAKELFAKDLILVVGGANLVITKTVNPTCGKVVTVGDKVNYHILFTNTGTDIPLAENFSIDGVLHAGVMLEDLLPSNLVLSKPVNSADYAKATPVEGVVVVQRKADVGTNKWVSYQAWDGSDSGSNTISKIGVYYPNAVLGRNRTGSLDFSVTVSDGITSSREYNQAGFLTGNHAVKFLSNTACTVLEPPVSGIIDETGLGTADSGNARIRFMQPAVVGSVPDFYSAGAFIDTPLYYLDSRTGYDLLKHGVYVQLHSSSSNTDEDVAETKEVLLTSSTGDTLKVVLVETGENTSIFRSLYPIRLSSQDKGSGHLCPATGTTPHYDQVAAECVLQGTTNGNLRADVTDSAKGALSDIALVDPKGMVFDALTSVPVAGATVTIRNADGSIAINPDTGTEYAATLTDSTGAFQYTRLYPESPAHSGQYYLDVQPPSRYSFPSVRPKAAYPLLHVNDYSYGKVGFSATSGSAGVFKLTSVNPLILVDIPLDPATDGMFIADKSTTTPKAGIGDIVKYSIALKNNSSMELYAVSIDDTLPYGFRYVKGSARLDDIPVVDPTGGEGPSLTFSSDRKADKDISIKITVGMTRTLSYLARITAGAVDSDGINRANAVGYSNTSFPVSSNKTLATVAVSQEGALLDRGLIIGQVYLEAACKTNTTHKDVPVGGVQLFLEDGSWVKSDAQGLFSMYGINVGNHVLKVDATTLPTGVKLAARDSRHLLDGDSRWIDIKPGEMHRADFMLVCPEQEEATTALIKTLQTRNEGLDGAWKLEQLAKQSTTTTTKTDDKLRNSTSVDGDLSNGTELNADKTVAKTLKSLVGYSLQLASHDSKEKAEEELKFLEKHVDQPVFVYQDGQVYTLRTGFVLKEEELSSVQATLKQREGFDTKIVHSVLDKLPVVIASSFGEELDTEAMPDPEKLAKTITREQGKDGTWLWPHKEISADGRFIFVTRQGLEPVLYVNGQPVGKDNIGIQVENHSEKAILTAWYGVNLQPGKNSLKVVAKDPFGNERVLSEKSFIQPSKGVRIVIQPQAKSLAADNGESIMPIKLRIEDEQGNAVKGVYYVTLTASDGQWVQPDIQDKTNGYQVRITNGERLVHLRSSGQAGEIKLTVEVDQMQQETKFAQITPLRPLIAVGLLDFGVSKFTQDNNGQAPTGDVPNADGKVEFDSRAAVFMKGRVWDDKTLTFAYDSNKSSDAELFRDIDPANYYPVYGDASSRGYEGQSRSKVYAKLEKDKHSIMWGDYSTGGGDDLVDLARIQRSLTGVNGVYDDGKNRVQVFGAEVKDGHIIELVPGNGTAMEYRLNHYPIVKHSEILEQVIYDRENQGLVIKTTKLTRFDDYVLDDVAGYLTFKEVIPSFDADNNPVYIRLSYDTENGNGNKNIVAGVRATSKVTDQVTLGASYSRDEDSINGADLTGLFGTYQPATDTKITASVANMKHNDDLKDDGKAARISAEKTWEDGSKSSLTWGRADAGFTNSGSGVSAGREELTATHSQKLNKDLKLEVEVTDSKSLTADERKTTVGATVNGKYEDWTLKGGARHIEQQNVGDNTGINTVILGAERPVNIAGKKGRLSAEIEQDTSTSERQRFKVGGEIALTPKANAYVNYEHINSLSGIGELSESASNDTFAIGVKGKINDKTDAYTEYRLRGDANDREAEAVSGVKAHYEFKPGFSIAPTAEVIRSLADGANKDAVAISTSIEDKRNKNARSMYRLEVRDTDTSTFLGANAAYVGRISELWSALAREELRVEFPDGKENSIDHTFTVGLARRGPDQDKNDLLVMYKNNQKRGPNSGDDQSTHIVSLHENMEVNDKLTLSGRLGAKVQTTQVSDQSFDSNAVLLDGRAIWDVNKRWSLDAHGGVLATDGFSEQRYSSGVGAYLLVKKNLRIGVDYNFQGFTDKDLDAQGYNSKGASVNLQYKFDEKDLQWLFD